jgi:nucleoside-diphosphate-sugar epimerase
MRVLVTGGANGLGHALVEKALAAGVSVFVVDVDARGLQQLPSQVTRVMADLGSEVDVAHALACLADEPAFDLVQPHRALTHLRGKLVRRFARHGSRQSISLPGSYDPETFAVFLRQEVTAHAIR